jgi:hypothetical protein
VACDQSGTAAIKATVRVGSHTLGLAHGSVAVVHAAPNVHSERVISPLSLALPKPNVADLLAVQLVDEAAGPLLTWAMGGCGCRGTARPASRRTPWCGRPA